MQETITGSSLRLSILLAWARSGATARADTVVATAVAAARVPADLVARRCDLVDLGSWARPSATARGDTVVTTAVAAARVLADFVALCDSAAQNSGW